MPMRVASAGTLWHLLVSAWQALTAKSHGADTSGPVPPAKTPQNCDGRALMRRREYLADAARKHRLHLRCKEASACEAEARRVVLDILRSGHGQA